MAARPRKTSYTNFPDTIDDKLSLTHMQLFHYVVRNADSHLKNRSFIYGLEVLRG